MRLRDLVDAATPGPWEWAEDRWNDHYAHKGAARWFWRLQGPQQHASGHPDPWDYHEVTGLRWYQFSARSRKDGVVGVPGQGDRALIAAAPAAITALLDEVERLRAEVERLRAEVERLRGGSP
jgi:hypothetical protein